MSPNLPRRFTRTSSLFLFTLALAGLLAAFALLRATPNGMGLTNDSAAYIGGARGILNGQGYTDIWLDSDLEPITHYPPLYSLLLAGLGLTGLDPLRGARVINVLVFGASTILMGLLGWKMTRLRLAGILLAVFFSTNASLIYVHADALSEALFLFLTLVSFILFYLHFDQEKAAWLAAAGAAVGLAYLTRYTGLALLATFVVALILLKETWRKRLISVFILLAGFIPFAAAWAIRNRILAGNATNRTVGWHPVTLDNARRGIYAFSSFILPLEEWQKTLYKSSMVSCFLVIVGLVLLVWLLATALRRFIRPQTRLQPDVLTFTTGLYIFGYLSAVIVSMSLFDASTKFQPRILSPVYVAVLVLLVAAGAWLWRQHYKLIRILTILLAIFCLTLSGLGFSRAFQDLQKTGQGYASWKWRDSVIMATLQELPGNVAIYTNSPPAVYLVVGRATRVMPTRVDAVTLEERRTYDIQVSHLREAVLQGSAVLVVFDLEDGGGSGLAQDVRTMVEGLPVLQKQSNDFIYGQP